MALIKLTINTDKVMADLRRWLSDPTERDRIAKKIDEWTDTGVFDKIDEAFIKKFLKDILAEDKIKE